MLKTRIMTVSLILAIVASLLLTYSTGIAAAKQVTADHSLSGATMTLNVGDTLSVTLTQQTGSTGFAWGLDSNSNPSVLSSLGHQTTPGNFLGGPGTDTWTFAALTPGSSTIDLEYRRPWESGSNGADSFRLTVIVTDPAVTVPASSNVSTLILVGGFAAIAFVLIARRQKAGTRP